MTDRATPSGFEAVAKVEDLPDTGYITARVGDYSIIIAKLGDGIFATENLCSHANSELAGGRFRMGRISCPLHGVIFDFRTGQVMGGTLTNVGLRTFVTLVDDGLVWVKTAPEAPKVGIMKR
jgi:3-phenylpropionate/trans-cinnamate dioxygenase ferredoxin component